MCLLEGDSPRSTARTTRRDPVAGARQTTVLVPPPALRPSLFQKGTPAEPLSIPFYGVYWMYRKPFRPPPANSHNRAAIPRSSRSARLTTCRCSWKRGRTSEEKLTRGVAGDPRGGEECR